MPTGCERQQQFGAAGVLPDVRRVVEILHDPRDRAEARTGGFGHMVGSGDFGSIVLVLVDLRFES